MSTPQKKKKTPKNKDTSESSVEHIVEQLIVSTENSLVEETTTLLNENLDKETSESENSPNLDEVSIITEIKEELQSEQEIIAEEAANFIPLHQTLDDFRDEDTYNVKDESAAIYQKNPVYKNVKPRLGRMTIDKNTGERKIIHLDE